MKKKQNNKSKVSFICFLIASVCSYINGIIGMINKDGSNCILNFCLGSSFLCLSTTYLNKDK